MSSSEQVPKNIAKASRPASFLCLAPETSSSYPTVRDIKPAMISRRSSSVSSNGSFRVLKLGPVHYGEHPDEHKADFYEVAVEASLRKHG
ncbi:hypothetical protein F4861DRAFT_536040 [Xylaria intraflava]|nr:hypothetical protein F4861DRAFT_536040 [Xylaria intraflava]